MVMSKARCRLFAYGVIDATAIPKHHNLLPHLNRDCFWYRLTQIVLEKRPLNGCSSSISSSIPITYLREVHSQFVRLSFMWMSTIVVAMLWISMEMLIAPCIVVVH